MGTGNTGGALLVVLTAAEARALVLACQVTEQGAWGGWCGQLLGATWPEQEAHAPAFAALAGRFVQLGQARPATNDGYLAAD